MLKPRFGAEFLESKEQERITQDVGVPLDITAALHARDALVNGAQVVRRVPILV